ncbi:MAG: hypothetical protein LBQ84_04190 [Flavobacteriaceae bacterium]|jgi:hypothetical protein|nr:hypothetical protein [Flavobacteriaceae bacterium]
MKKTVFFILLLLSFPAFSQMVELKKLSAGKIITRTMLYDHEKEDVYGYFYIFEKDKISKKEGLYEYVLLDKNLNKVISGEFKEQKLSFLKYFYFYCIYKKGFISITVQDALLMNYSLRSRHRLLDVKENKLSDSFTWLPDLTKEYNPVDRKGKEYVSFFFHNNFGYQLFTPMETYKKLSGERNEIHFINEKLEPVWSYSYNKEKNKTEYNSIYFVDSDNKHNNNIIVAARHFNGKGNEAKIKRGELPQANFLFFNKNDGKLITEISTLGKKTAEKEIKDVAGHKIFVNEQKNVVTFINRTMNTKKVILDEDLIQGFSKIEYSLSDGKELKRDYFSWNQLSDHLDIDENGYVREKDDPNGYLYPHNTLMKENGNIIFILEEYRPLRGSVVLSISSPGAKVNDLFLVELDKDMKLVQFKRIEKEKKTIRNGIKMSGSLVDYYGYFDYAGYQDLDNDNYLFFYYNKQEPEGGGKKQWMLGIVSYIDGKISEQKLPLKSEDGSRMTITPAKKGYVIIYETFKDKDRSSELRLEKINY